MHRSHAHGGTTYIVLGRFGRSEFDISLWPVVVASVFLGGAEDAFWRLGHLACTTTTTGSVRTVIFLCGRSSSLSSAVLFLWSFF